MRKNANRHLERVIHRAICIAELGGQDYRMQNDVAVRTLRRMRPDLTAAQALATVDLVRRKNLDLDWHQSAEETKKPVSSTV
jgi:hypothetical protein